MGTKGTWQRPMQVTPEEFETNWERVFGEKEERTEEAEETGPAEQSE